MTGHFRLLVWKEGFKKVVIKEFELHVQDKPETASVSEQVTVQGGGLVNATMRRSGGPHLDEPAGR